MNRGESNADAIIILVVVIVVGLILPRLITTPDKSSSNSKEPASNSGENIITPDIAPVESDYSGKFSISTGNARSTFQSYEEYVSIRNRSGKTVDITGWQLRNGRGQRAYNIYGSLQYFPSETELIPQGTILLSPTGEHFVQNIILEPNESAYITTGSMGAQAPFKIISFKENMCTGYLEDEPAYEFTPKLSRDCPSPRDEPGISYLDTECRKFIERLPRCRIPEFDTRDEDDNICHHCINGTPQSSACVAYAKEHFSYKGCIATHGNNSEFFGNTWRIFLGRKWEMWADSYETINLLDRLGRLVESKSWK